MAGAWTTINILDATGTSKTMRVWSENSTTGPYSFGQALDDGSGAGVIPAIKAGAALPAASTDPALVVTIRDINANGATTSSASAPVVPATDWVGTTALGKFGTGYYVACPASTTTTLQSSAGATGDYISGVLIIPGSTSPSSVALLDNVTSMTVFAGGASSVSNLVPFFVPLGAVSRSGAWKITTGGTNVTCLAIGKFS
jgi:hypothetical protein